MAGCGATRTAVPDLTTPAAPRGTVLRSYPDAGVTFRAPANWAAAPGSAPVAATFSSGEAIVTVWRYPRTEPLPATGRDLKGALTRLMGIVTSRDPRITYTGRRVTRVGGAPAIVLTGRERVSGILRGVRSVHVYASGAEVVLDAIAPVGSFPALDRSVFRPAGASLRVTAARP